MKLTAWGLVEPIKKLLGMPGIDVNLCNQFFMHVNLSDSFQVNHPNNAGNTALSLAANNGHNEVLRLLLEREEIQVHGADKTGIINIPCSNTKQSKYS